MALQLSDIINKLQDVDTAMQNGQISTTEAKKKLKEINNNLKQHIEHLKENAKDKESEDLPITALDVYVDGSYNISTGDAGYGLVYKENDKLYTENGCVDNAYALGRNVAGEIQAATRAVQIAVEKKYKKVNIYYDYKGIECWARGIWKANKSNTKAYRDFMTEAAKNIIINFHKVAAHTGVKLNEKADQEAKLGCGVQ